MLSILALLSCAMPAQTNLDRVAFIPSTQDEQRLGESFTDLGDVNNDGVPDFAVGSPGHLPTSGGWGSGLVEVFSGADRSLLYHLNPVPSVDSLLGKNLVTIGDVNQDGALDFVVGAGGYVGAYVVSGRDGVRLASIDTNSNGQFGMQIAVIGDINGDSLPEFAIGLPVEIVGSYSNAGRIMIMNGATGTLLQELQGAESYRSLGNTLCGPGDLNGDGIPDLLVNGADGLTIPSDGLTALSGADFQPIYVISRSELRQQVRDLDALGDVDQDGVGDYVVTGYQENSAGNWFQGLSRVMSGATGEQIFKLTGYEFEDFGRNAVALGDLDGDGTNDFATISMLLNQVWRIRPRIDVFSGATGEEIAMAQTPNHNFFVVRIFSMSDIDNDGRDEIVIGVPEEQINTTPGFLPGGELHIFGIK